MINYFISVLLHVEITADKTLVCKIYHVIGNLYMGKKNSHEVLPDLATKKL